MVSMARGPAGSLTAALSANRRVVTGGPSGPARPVVSGRRHVMDVVVERCAGLDVHRDSVVATVRLPGRGRSRRRREQQTRSFATTIAQLEALADWLQGFGVTLVGMEATGVTGSRSSTCSKTGSSAG